MDRTLTAAIALDLGSTSVKAAALDRQSNLQHIVSQPAPAIDHRQGRYESDAMEYARIAGHVLQTCRAQTGEKAPLGLCSQRSSFLIWDKTSGKPVTPLISWQDDRGKSCCEHLQTSADTLHTLTGLRLTPYYFAPKLSVLLQQNPSWREKLVQGEWLAGTLDTFLIWRWTNGTHFVTDTSMAARTLLMDIRQQQWSDTLCRLFDVPCSILPYIKPSSGMNLPLNIGLTLQASVGDQSAALIASLTDHASEALVNLGTGGFVIRSLAPGTPAFDGYLQTLVYQDNQRETRFAVEGTLNSIAAALAPYPVQDCGMEDLAQNDIFCLAEPSGLGAPYFRSDWGIHFSTSTAGLSTQQIAALLLEVIIFRVARILEDFHCHSPLTRAYLSGGLSELLCLQQGIAQCAPCPVWHLQQKEASLQGAALLACELKITGQRKAEKIEIKQANTALAGKYRRWKVWLDALLKT
ncbi:MAG: carbohydrate kinase [Proteobacteria bacterium]|nr:carbohydrate kinase [Pseudomonadota bacterium]